MSILSNHSADSMIKFVITRGWVIFYVTQYLNETNVIFVRRFQYCLTKTKKAKFKLILTFCDVL